MNARIPPSAKELRRARQIAEIEYKKVAKKERDGMARRIIKTMIYVLHEYFGFGIIRAARAMHYFQKTIEQSDQDEVYWEHIDQVVIDYLKIGFERDYTDRGKVASEPRGNDK